MGMNVAVPKVQEEVKKLTLDEFKKMIPSRASTITQDLVDIIQDSTTEPEFQGATLLQSIIDYESTMVKHKASMREYVRAVRFCAFLLASEDGYTEAYKKAFSDRQFVKDRLGIDTSSGKYNELTFAASRYRRSALVVSVLTMAQVPEDILLGNARMQAYGVLADRMVNSKYDKDKITAAKELLSASRPPDNNKITMEVGPSQSAISMQDKLMAQLSGIASSQHARLKAGESITDVQQIGLTVDEVHDDEVNVEDAEVVG